MQNLQKKNMLSKYMKMWTISYINNKMQNLPDTKIYIPKGISYSSTRMLNLSKGHVKRELSHTAYGNIGVRRL